MQRKPNAEKNPADAAETRSQAAQEPASKYRTNPQVEAELAQWRERNPAQVDYVRNMPRERLENSYFLRLARGAPARGRARGHRRAVHGGRASFAGLHGPRAEAR